MSDLANSAEPEVSPERAILEYLRYNEPYTIDQHENGSGYYITFPEQDVSYNLSPAINAHVSLLGPGDTRRRFPNASEALHQEVDNARQELFHARLFQTYTVMFESMEDRFGQVRRMEASDQVVEALTVFNAAREATERVHRAVANRQVARAARAHGQGSGQSGGSGGGGDVEPSTRHSSSSRSSGSRRSRR